MARRKLDGVARRPALHDEAAPDVAFSDGNPFTADDVVFSLAAAYDEKGGSILADSLRVGGKNLAAAPSTRRPSS